MRDAIEGALSDVNLLGTEAQVRLASHAARALVAGRTVHTAELVVSLRDFAAPTVVATHLGAPTDGPVVAATRALPQVPLWPGGCDPPADLHAYAPRRPPRFDLVPTGTPVPGHRLLGGWKDVRALTFPAEQPAPRPAASKQCSSVLCSDGP